MAVLADGRHGVFITSRHLRASDPDSPAAAVAFAVLRPPQFGHLENLRTGETSCLSPPGGGGGGGGGVPASASCSVPQEPTSEDASRSRTWTAAPSSTSSLPGRRSPTTASGSAPPTRRGTRRRLTCGFVGRYRDASVFSCLLLSSVPQTGPVLVPGPALRHLLQNLRVGRRTSGPDRTQREKRRAGVRGHPGRSGSSPRVLVPTRPSSVRHPCRWRTEPPKWAGTSATAAPDWSSSTRVSLGNDIGSGPGPGPGLGSMMT